MLKGACRRSGVDEWKVHFLHLESARLGHQGVRLWGMAAPLHPGLEPGRLPMGTVPLNWWNKYIKWNKIVMKNSHHSHPLVAPRLYWWFGCHGPQPEKPGQKKDMLMTGTNWGTLLRTP